MELGLCSSLKLSSSEFLWESPLPSTEEGLHTQTHTQQLAGKKTKTLKQYFITRLYTIVLPWAATVAWWCDIVAWWCGAVLWWGWYWFHLVLHSIQQNFASGLHMSHLLGQVLLLILIIFIQQILPCPLLKLPLWGEMNRYRFCKCRGISLVRCFYLLKSKDA